MQSGPGSQLAGRLLRYKRSVISERVVFIKAKRDTIMIQAYTKHKPLDRILPSGINCTLLSFPTRREFSAGVVNNDEAKVLMKALNHLMDIVEYRDLFDSKLHLSKPGFCLV